MVSNSENPLSAIYELRDSALLLSLGNAFLCDDPLLVKIGHGIEGNLHSLKGQILSLKKNFPGKFAREIQTDDIIDGLQDTAKRLQKPDQEINEKCTVGLLGKEMEEGVRALAQALKEIRAQVDGETPSYTAKDSVKNMVGNVADVGSTVGRTVKWLVKLLVVCILVAFLGFIYLFYTMEHEGTLAEEIAKSEAQLKSQKERMAQLEDEKKRISRQIARIKSMRKSRQNKIEILELGGEAHEIDKKQHDVEVEISVQERIVKDNKARIEEIRKKPFLKRLLRQ